MTTQGIARCLSAMCCPLQVPRNHTSLSQAWSKASPRRTDFQTMKIIRRFRTSNSQPKDLTPLVQFSNARLAYPKDGINEDSESSSDQKASVSATAELYLENYSILLPDWNDPANDDGNGNKSKGGIAIVGKNGSGKTLLGKAIIAAEDSSRIDSSNPYIVSGSVDMPLKDKQNVASTFNRKDRHLLGRGGRTTQSSPRSTTVAHVSFDSHRKLLEDRDEKSGDSVTAFKAIATAGHAPGRLNPAARFLVIRFGLYPMLHRTVDTLSTGEIRKVLLARALSTKPSLLILDHAFDGLDLPSRKILQELVSKTIKGFTNDLLVQGVSSKDTADKTQVLLMSHRAEELDEIQELDTVAWCDNDSDENTWNVLRRSFLLQGDDHDDTENNTWSSGEEVLHRAMGLDFKAKTSKNTTWGIDCEDPNLPSEESIRKWWNLGVEIPSSAITQSDNEIVVNTGNLTVQKGDAILLQNLTWTVRRGERWIIGGGNGAGKSTLSRLLAHSPVTGEKANTNENLQILPNHDPNHPRTTIGWVSTESHMHYQQQLDQDSEKIITTRDFIRDQSANAAWDDAILPVLEWLGIVEESSASLLDRPFHTLSQGEQKMVLIATALVGRPPLLILDEPCQGLDLVNRKRLLQVVDIICRSTDMALIYITHHLDEELVPSISHALHLKDRREVYKGQIENYSPKDYSDEDEL
eukprot:CAMPEP_0116105574 /NCGR_PEP_ID=MMETSP0327-20121206/15116_1 /TAXON_ID=44447 /ORGANISM="Pseudo-nitzschia delicatissima, Strain B596" /LENGTH=693 /DNA_ID=CAMNT_0003598011 /DNA_START=197 /DNA_END=2275 /DNA_ORIENTATION=+